LTGAVISFILIQFLRAVITFKILHYATTNMHNKMTDVVLRAKILFFDSNPIGRIVTRFSKDLIMLDLVLPPISFIVTLGFFRTASVVVTVAVISPVMLIPTAFAFILMLLIIRTGLSSMMETQREDAICRTPIHNAFSMTVNGLVTLRAFEKTEYFRYGFVQDLEKGANVTFSYNLANRWLGLNLDFTCLLFSSSVAIFCILAKGSIPSE
jgi:ATP-binding cassette, subfamily C (CFTR/MRP), member 4